MTGGPTVHRTHSPWPGKPAQARDGPRRAAARACARVKASRPRWPFRLPRRSVLLSRGHPLSLTFSERAAVSTSSPGRASRPGRVRRGIRDRWRWRRVQAEGPLLAVEGARRWERVWPPSPRTRRPPCCTPHGPGQVRATNPTLAEGTLHPGAKGLSCSTQCLTTQHIPGRTARQHEDGETAPRSLWPRVRRRAGRPRRRNR